MAGDQSPRTGIFPNLHRASDRDSQQQDSLQVSKVLIIESSMNHQGPKEDSRLRGRARLAGPRTSSASIESTNDHHEAREKLTMLRSNSRICRAPVQAIDLMKA